MPLTRAMRRGRDRDGPPRTPTPEKSAESAQDSQFRPQVAEEEVAESAVPSVPSAASLSIHTPSTSSAQLPVLERLLDRLVSRQEHQDAVHRELQQQLAATVRSAGSTTDVTPAQAMARTIRQHGAEVYEGVGDPEVFDRWVRRFEKLFITFETPRRCRWVLPPII